MGQRAPTFRSVASHRDNVSSPCVGRRASFSCTQHGLHEEVVGFMRYESYGKAIGPPARRCRSVGKTLRICVPRRLPMAKCSRDAFPSVRRWRDCALMRPWPDWQWQYTRAMRSRGPCRGKIPPRCVPGRQSVAIISPHVSQKGSRAGKSPLPGKIRTPCIRKRAGFGRICAPCIRNAPQTAVGGYTARRSCREGALFAAQAPRIMHTARILPSSDA